MPVGSDKLCAPDELPALSNWNVISVLYRYDLGLIEACQQIIRRALNRTTLIGFTGQELKTFATQSGNEITRLTVATTRRYQQHSEWKEKTQWHDFVLYGGAAQSAARLPKGTHVYIEGELTYREYNRTIETESGSVDVHGPLRNCRGFH